jgi:hypothetical protein
MATERGFVLRSSRAFRYCIVGIGVMLLGVLYWFVWRVGLPKVFGYELVPRKEKLEDGTVVTLVRNCYSYPRPRMRLIPFPAVLEGESPVMESTVAKETMDVLSSRA